MADDDARANTRDFLVSAQANARMNQRGSVKPMAIPKSAQDAVYGADGAVLWGPGVPLTPATQEPVRYVDFNPNVNLQRHPRAFEGFSFEQLRSFANVELVRLAIETRKEQIEGLNWAIQLRDPKAGEKKDNSPIAKQLVGFFRKPDGEHEFSTWTRMLVEEMLVLDAVALERQRLRNGKLAGLLLVPGHTIHPMVDATGRRPKGDNVVAYQQIIRGRIWANLTDSDLIYAPRNPRPGKIFGFGPVEQVIVTIQTAIARQAAQLGYFTDGNIPAGILTGPEGWTTAQLQELQMLFDQRLKGDVNHKSNLLWVPNGTKYSAFKESPLKDEFDEWLARVVTYCFNLPPTPFIRQMNRGTASNDTERGAEEGLMPVKLWLKRLFDGVIANDLAQPDYEFVWVDNTETDIDKQAKVDDLYLRNGSITINEVRVRRGMAPIMDGDTPLIYSPSGVLPLDTLMAAPVESQGNGQPTQPGGGGKTPVQGPQPPKTTPGAPGPKQQAKSPEAQQKTKKLAKAADGKKLPPVSANRPFARRRANEMTDAAHTALHKAASAVGAHLERQLRGMHKAITLDGDSTNPYDILYEGDEGDDSAKGKAKKIAKTLPLAALAPLGLAVHGAMRDLAYDSAAQQFAATGAPLTEDVQRELQSDAADYADTRSAELVTAGADAGIVDSTRNMVADTIAAGLLGGHSAERIADDVMGSHAFSYDRADDIGQTEARKANGAGLLAGAKLASELSGQVFKKSWATEGDEKVEELCMANEAAGEIDLDDTFPSGDDTTPAHPNCRCDVIIIMPAPAAAS